MDVTQTVTRLKNNDPTLTELDTVFMYGLKSEEIIELCQALEQNTIVKLVDFRETNIDENAAEAIAAMVKKNSTIKTFMLLRSRITGNANQIMEALTENASITSLYADAAPISGAALGALLASNNRLEYFWLTNLRMTGYAVQALAQGLAINSGLKRLEINEPYENSENNFGDKGVQALSEALHRNTALEELFLESSGMTEVGGVGLFRMLKEHPSLKQLYIHYDKVGSEAAKVLAESLAANPVLEYFFSSYNGFGDEGVIAIASALPHNTNLRKLYLQSQELGQDGGLALGLGLKENRGLELLHLWENKVGDLGAVAIAQAMHKHPTLKDLDLSKNELTAAGGVAIGQALKGNQKLERLSLNFNPIGDLALNAIAEGLKPKMKEFVVGRNGEISVQSLPVSQTALKSLNLCDTGITEAGARVLLEALKINTTLVELDLSNNHLSKDLIKEFDELLERNKQQSLKTTPLVVKQGLFAVREDGVDMKQPGSLVNQRCLDARL